MTGGTLDALLEAIPLPAILVGQAERILGANALARGQLGQDISGRHVVIVIRQPTVLDAIEAVLNDGQARTTRFPTTREGQDLTFEVTCTHVEMDAGKGVVVCFQDVTHVDKADQMRRDFVANVSHELRTPLTALLGFIETLRGPARKDPAATERFLGIMAVEAARMERLVRDLLSLSRVESEERLRPTEEVDLQALVMSVRSSLVPLAQRTGVDLVVDAGSDPVSVPGDPDQLRQVLNNLVENAIKYGSSGGVVTIGLEASDHVVGLRGPGATLCVADRGPGIAEVHLPRLTERFYRVDSHRSREMGGTGLGLAIVKHIVNRHRGRLRIESTEGEGTTIRISLPAR